MEDKNARSETTSFMPVKAVCDLDDLIKAVQLSLPRVKPWQRQLHQYLGEVDRHVQIVRMTIAMERGAQEVAEAVHQLRTALRVAQRYLAAGRADLGTKAAVLFAYELGQRIATELAPQIHEATGLNGKHTGGDQDAEHGGQ